MIFSNKIINDSETSKAEASQESLLKMIDEGYVIADHSFDHMSHNSRNSPIDAYKDVEKDMVSEKFLFCKKFRQIIFICLCVISNIISD